MVSNPTGSPFPSRMRLVATVVPWNSCPSALGVSEACSNTASMPVMTPPEGSWGVEGVLPVHISAGAPIKEGDVGEGSSGVYREGITQICARSFELVRVVAAVEEAVDRRPIGPARVGAGIVDRLAVGGQHHAIFSLRGGSAQESASNVCVHPLGLAIMGMSPSASAAGFEPQHLAPVQHVSVAEGLERSLVRLPWIDHCPTDAPVPAAFDSPGRFAYPIDADGKSDRRRPAPRFPAPPRIPHASGQVPPSRGGPRRRGRRTG